MGKGGWGGLKGKIMGGVERVGSNGLKGDGGGNEVGRIKGK